MAVPQIRVFEVRIVSINGSAIADVVVDAGGILSPLAIAVDLDAVNPGGAAIDFAVESGIAGNLDVQAVE